MLIDVRYLAAREVKWGLLLQVITILTWPKMTRIVSRKLIVKMPSAIAHLPIYSHFS
jgi:hypothetical protein